MLVDAITFEITNSKLNFHDEYVIEATEDNYEKVLSHRYTHDIKFKSFQDFDFLRKEHMPVAFYEIPDTIDPVDEMVGVL